MPGLTQYRLEISLWTEKRRDEHAIEKSLIHMASLTFMLMFWFYNSAGFAEFDLQNRCFEQGTVAMLTRMRIEAPAPRFNMSRQAAGNELTDRVQMAMDNDTLIRVSKLE